MGRSSEEELPDDQDANRNEAEEGDPLPNTTAGITGGVPMTSESPTTTSARPETAGKGVSGASQTPTTTAASPVVGGKRVPDASQSPSTAAARLVTGGKGVPGAVGGVRTMKPSSSKTHRRKTVSTRVDIAFEDGLFAGNAHVVSKPTITVRRRFVVLKRFLADSARVRAM